MQRMAEPAKARQVKRFTACTLGYNSSILRVFRCTGHAVEITQEGRDFAVRIAFEEAPGVARPLCANPWDVALRSWWRRQRAARRTSVELF